MTYDASAKNVSLELLKGSVCKLGMTYAEVVARGLFVRLCRSGAEFYPVAVARETFGGNVYIQGFLA